MDEFELVIHVEPDQLDALSASLIGCGVEAVVTPKMSFEAVSTGVVIAIVAKSLISATRDVLIQFLQGRTDVKKLEYLKIGKSEHRDVDAAKLSELFDLLRAGNLDEPDR